MRADHNKSALFLLYVLDACTRASDSRENKCAFRYLFHGVELSVPWDGTKCSTPWNKWRSVVALKSKQQVDNDKGGLLCNKGVVINRVNSNGQSS